MVIQWIVVYHEVTVLGVIYYCACKRCNMELLPLFFTQAETFASQVSIDRKVGSFVEPFEGDSATLNGIFRHLYRARMVLSLENFADSGIAPGAITPPFQLSGAEAPHQDANGFGLSTTPLTVSSLCVYRKRYLALWK